MTNHEPTSDEDKMMQGGVLFGIGFLLATFLEAGAGVDEVVTWGICGPIVIAGVIRFVDGLRA